MVEKVADLENRWAIAICRLVHPPDINPTVYARGVLVQLDLGILLATLVHNSAEVILRGYLDLMHSRRLDRCRGSLDVLLCDVLFVQRWCRTNPCPRKRCLAAGKPCNGARPRSCN